MCFNQLFQGMDNMDDILEEQWNLDLDDEDWEDEDGWEVPIFQWWSKFNFLVICPSQHNEFSYAKSIVINNNSKN